jgi:hypothetical protein
MEGNAGIEPESKFHRRTQMKSSLGVKSIIFFLISILFLILLTLFESSLVGLSLTVERIISLFLLVLPAMIGIVFGVLSFVRKEARLWIGILGILLNALFALFHLLVLSFAG